MTVVYATCLTTCGLPGYRLRAPLPVEVRVESSSTHRSSLYSARVPDVPTLFDLERHRTSRGVEQHELHNWHAAGYGSPAEALSEVRRFLVMWLSATSWATGPMQDMREAFRREWLVPLQEPVL